AESRTLDARDLKRKLRSIHSHSISGSPERNSSVFSRIRRDRSESPRHRLEGRRDGGVFNRLGDTEAFSEIEDSRGGHWKSRSKKEKLRIEEDELSQLWTRSPRVMSSIDDIQAVGSDTRPPMLDMTNYESWSQRIRLYCRGKENRLHILQSRTYDDLSDNEKKRYDADVRDDVKMLLAGSELTKEDRESQLYDEFERFKMLPGENINEYYVRFHKLVNDMRNTRMTMPNIQLNSKFVNNMSPEWGRFVIAVKLNKGRQNVQGCKERSPPYTFDEDVDNQPVQDLALNEDKIFQANECDAFDSDVDDEPTAQSIFMANLSSAGLANLQAGPSNASTLSEVHILENANDHSVTNQDRYEIHIEVQHANVIDSTTIDMGNSNVIPYEQYLSVNNVSVIPSCASFALNDACVLFNNDAYVPHDPIATELKIYKEQVAIYEQCAKFELTKREQRMDDQMRMLIQNRNKTEENLKTELHSVKLQLNSTMENNKIIEETVTVLKQEFKQKENKFLTDFSNLKHLNDKLENKLHSQDQSIQTVHMMLNPTKAKKTQSALYDGEELLKTHHVPVIVPSSEEDLELAEHTRIKMHEKMNGSVCGEKRVKILPHNYSKENFMATFTPQTQLIPEQVFWSLDLEKRKAEKLKANTPPLPVLPPATVYPPNTPVHLVPRTLPTTSQVNIGQMKAVFENLEAEVDQNEIDLKSSEIERKNLLIANENLIVECLSKDVFYTATDSVLNVSRFSDMHDAFTIAQKRIADLESENFNLRNKIQNDDHDSLIKHFSKLEVEHFNLQLKYQHLKERFGTIKPVTSSDAPSFDSLFVIGQLNEQIQSRGNTIHELKEKISRLTKKNSDADPIYDLKALVSLNKDLTAKLNVLHDLNERFRAENAKVKQHYKELTQLKDNSNCVTIPDSKPKVLAPSRYPIHVEPIFPRHKNNRWKGDHWITSLSSLEIGHQLFRYTKHLRREELLGNVIRKATWSLDFIASHLRRGPRSD
ncbi:hypothetical protein Tco_1131234, partial [Tanacetum coccineum]